MDRILKAIKSKILELTKKKESLDQEFEDKIQNGKPVNIEFQKKRNFIDGELLGYKKSIDIINDSVDDNYPDW